VPLVRGNDRQRDRKGWDEVQEPTWRLRQRAVLGPALALVSMFAGLTLLFTSTAAAAYTPPYAPAPASQRFGVNGQGLFWIVPGLNWGSQVSEMRDDDIQIVRADALWANVQPTVADGADHVYDWATLDSIESSLAGQGLRWFPIIDYSAPWDASLNSSDGQPDIFSAPKSDADYAAYAVALVKRYGPGGDFWQAHPSLPDIPVTGVEVWNEENLPEFWTNPDPASYFELYETTRTAIHRAVPGVEVVVGGLVNPSSVFLDSMYAVGGERRGLFDGVAIHPYGNTVALVEHNVEVARHTLDQHHDIDTPLDVTEVGWPSLLAKTGLAGLLSSPPQLPFITDAQRAADLRTVTDAITGSDCGIERFIPDTWVSPERVATDAEDWFGIVSPSGVQSQTATAYHEALAALEGQAVTTSAGNTLCGRSFSLDGSATVRTIRHRDRRHSTVTLEACMRVRAVAYGAPVDAASVTFTVVRGESSRRLERMSTGAQGTALACTKAAPNTVVGLVASATRPDFNPVETSRVQIRVR
jgi:hypothetical protein